MNFLQKWYHFLESCPINHAFPAEATSDTRLPLKTHFDLSRDPGPFVCHELVVPQHAVGSALARFSSLSCASSLVM